MNTIAERIRLLNTIYFAIAGMLLIFSAVVLFFNLTRSPIDPNLPDAVVYLPFVLVVLFYPAANFVFRSYLSQNLKVDSTLEQKIGTYQTAVLIKAGLFEIPGLIACVLAFITGKADILGVTLIIIFFFYLHRPGATNISSHLNLREEENIELQT